MDPVQGNGGPGWNVTFTVPDADGAAARAPNSVRRFSSSRSTFPGRAITVIRDPQGAHLTLSQFKPPL